MSSVAVVKARIAASQAMVPWKGKRCSSAWPWLSWMWVETTRSRSGSKAGGTPAVRGAGAGGGRGVGVPGGGGRGGGAGRGGRAGAGGGGRPGRGGGRRLRVRDAPGRR